MSHRLLSLPLPPTIAVIATTVSVIAATAFKATLKLRAADIKANETQCAIICAQTAAKASEEAAREEINAAKADAEAARAEINAAKADAEAARAEINAAKADAEAARAEVNAARAEAQAARQAEAEAKVALQAAIAVAARAQGETKAAAALAATTLCSTPVVSPSRRRRRSLTPSSQAQSLQAKMAYEASEAVASALVDVLESAPPSLGSVSRASSLLRETSIVPGLEAPSAYQPLGAEDEGEEELIEHEATEEERSAFSSATSSNDGHASGYQPFSNRNTTPTRAAAHDDADDEEEEASEEFGDVVDWVAVRGQVGATARLVYERILAMAELIEEQEEEHGLIDEVEEVEELQQEPKQQEEADAQGPEQESASGPFHTNW